MSQISSETIFCYVILQARQQRKRALNNTQHCKRKEKKKRKKKEDFLGYKLCVRKQNSQCTET